MNEVHRWAREQPSSRTPWLMTPRIPCPPSLEAPGESVNRLLSVRHGHWERAALVAGAPLRSVRLRMAQALPRFAS